jgi:ubiquitin-conjugating enzyme E2 D/E
MAQNKLNKELKNLRTDPMPQGDAAPKGEDMYTWEGYIHGPEGTPYEGGKFKFDLKFPAEYPFKPPKINFSTKVLHPNITDQASAAIFRCAHP